MSNYRFLNDGTSQKVDTIAFSLFFTQKKKAFILFFPKKKGF